jgi:hypothetical protein
MNSNQINRIVDRICVELGICLPPAEKESLAGCEFLGAEGLADEICKREGLDPIMVERKLYRQILEEISNETQA